jgi:pantothenate kinase
MNKVENLAFEIKQLQTNQNRRIIVGIYGIPGSGKSTLASDLSDKLLSSIVVPMDGFHYTKAELRTFDDPVKAFERRGAPYTFNGNSFLDLVKKLSNDDDRVYAPSFDHSVGDPVENDIEITAGNSIILLEGLYLGLSENPWSYIFDLLDFSVFIDIPIEIAMTRVVKRHLINISGVDATKRVDHNDRPNAEYIIKNSQSASIILDYKLIHYFKL